MATALTINNRITVKGILAAGVTNPIKELLHNQTATVAAMQTRAALKATRRKLLGIKTAREIFRFYYSEYRHNAVTL